jgi:hypothetical protein
MYCLILLIGSIQLRRKRPISAALASSSDTVELTASAPCIESEEISDEPGSSLKDKGKQTHTIDSRSIVGSEKTFTDQGKQSNYKGGYLMTGSKQNITFGSFSKTDQARKRLFTDQGKQANEGSYLMTGSQPNLNSGSFSKTDQARKRLFTDQ